MRVTQLACLALLAMGASCLMAAAALAIDPDEPTPLSANAAIQYWQAFSQLPAVSAEQEKLFAAVDSASVQKPEALKLTQESAKSLMYLQRGALQTGCDWGLDYHDGIALLLPHLAKGRDLARLATLEARQTFERRQWAAGWSRATDTMALGRHVARDPFLVGLMVGAGIEDMAISAAAPYLPEMKLSYSQAAADIAALPRAATFSDALRIERKYITEWIIRKLQEQEKQGGDAWKDFWTALFTGTPGEVPRVDSAKSAIKMVQDILPLYDELARLMTLSPREFEIQHAAFMQKAKAKYPLAGLLLPGIDKARHRQQRTEARLAMLLAAIAVVDQGTDKLPSIRDPYGDGPFDYEARDKGFQLRSKLVIEGQPVTLVVGRE